MDNTKLCTEPRVPTPRYGQYLIRAHNHITPAVAAMDSCFALIGAHQHLIAVGSMSGETPAKKLGCPRASLRETAGQPCLRSGSSSLTSLSVNLISPHFIYLFVHPCISRWRTLLSVDDLVDEVITTLDAGKLLNNTYVIFSSDNGFHLGKRYFLHLLNIYFVQCKNYLILSLRQGRDCSQFPPYSNE